MNAIKKTSKLRERSTPNKMRLLSILLMLCMVFTLLPMTSFAATTIFPKKLSISKEVVQEGGNGTPPPETFEFVITDAAGLTPPPGDSGITFPELMKIETAGGIGKSEKTFDVEIDIAKATEDNDWTKIPMPDDETWYQKTLYLTEKNDGKANWIYGQERYAVTITVYPNGDPLLEIHVPGDDVPAKAEFKNTYKENGDKSITIPFRKIVKQGGSQKPGNTTFTLDIMPYGDPHADIKSLTITGASIVTNGADTYDREITIVGSEDVFPREFIITEKNDGAENWSYDTAKYIVRPDSGNSITILKDKGEDMNPEPAQWVEFTNTYTKNVADPKPTDPAKPEPIKPEPAKPEPAKPEPVKPGQMTSPKTGDESNMLLWLALLLASCGGVITTCVVKRKKSQSRQD